MIQVKLPFDLKSAQAGEPVVYEDGSPIAELITSSKAKPLQRLISVDYAGDVYFHNSEGIGVKTLYLQTLALEGRIEDDQVITEKGSFPCKQLFDEGYKQHGDFPDPYLQRIMDTSRLHEMCPAYVELMKKYGFMINLTAKRIYFKT